MAEGEAFELRVVARSQKPVAGRLHIYRNEVSIGSLDVHLKGGRADVITIRQTADEAGLLRYRATLELPLEDVTRGPDASEFSCPGSVLRALPSDARLCYGLPPSVAIFFSRSAAWSLTPPDKDEEGRKDERQLDVLLRYAPQRTLLSGWIREPELIADRAAWVRAQHGEGTLHLFGFRPQYRSWSQAAFHMLFRAILFGDV